VTGKDVAVAGLPTPNKRHATVMTRFAADCIAKMSELTAELEDTLGAVSTECVSTGVTCELIANT
jgi:hypothetical protein